MQSNNNFKPSKARAKANIDLIFDSSMVVNAAYDKMKEFINGLNLDDIPDDKKLELLNLLEAKLSKFNRPIQIFGGNQFIGQNQFIMNQEVFNGFISSLITALKDNFGEEIGAEIVKEAIRVAIEKM